MGLSTFAKIATGWIIATAGGLYAFTLSKKSINAKRYETMLARQRMKEAGYRD